MPTPSMNLYNKLYIKIGNVGNNVRIQKNCYAYTKLAFIYKWYVKIDGVGNIVRIKKNFCLHQAWIFIINYILELT